MGSILTVCLYVIEVLVAILLGIVVMLQKGKDGGAAGITMGGGMGEAVFGAQVGNVLTKATVVLGIVFLLNTLVLSIVSMKSNASVVAGDVAAPAPAAQEVPPLPTAPAPAVPAQ
ncbi:MAG: preprotein translocase subunit SecG [Kiritimatiellia bacterium]